jgi:hypothetical protein
LLSLARFGGKATSEPASDYVSTFRGEGVEPDLVALAVADHVAFHEISRWPSWPRSPTTADSVSVSGASAADAIAERGFAARANESDESREEREPARPEPDDPRIARASTESAIDKTSVAVMIPIQMKQTSGPPE